MAIKTIQAYTRKDGRRVAKHTKRFYKKQKPMKHEFERKKYRKGFFNWLDRSDSR